MEDEIRILVNKIIVNYTRRTNIVGAFLDQEELINKVISKKDKFDPTKGKFNSYFSYITNNYMSVLLNRHAIVSIRKNKIKKLNTMFNGR